MWHESNISHATDFGTTKRHSSWKYSLGEVLVLKGLKYKKQSSGEGQGREPRLTGRSFTIICNHFKMSRM
jgi:hypothetical protein